MFWIEVPKFKSVQLGRQVGWIWCGGKGVTLGGFSCPSLIVRCQGSTLPRPWHLFLHALLICRAQSGGSMLGSWEFGTCGTSQCLKSSLILRTSFFSLLNLVFEFKGSGFSFFSLTWWYTQHWRNHHVNCVVYAQDSRCDDDRTGNQWDKMLDSVAEARLRA